MKTTLGKIMSYDPCGQMKGSNMGWDKLVSFLGTDDLSTEVTFRQILESNGIEDTIWALRTKNYRDYCLFLAEVAESVLHIYEKENPNDDRPRKCIEGIRRYHFGEISLDELKELSDDASSAAWTVTRATSSAARVAAWAVWAAAKSTSWAASNVAGRAASAAASAATRAAMDVSCAKWKEMEKILLKYI